MKPKEKDISPRVQLFPDGKYHWRYDVNLFTNPSILIDVFKVLGITVGIVVVLNLLIGSCAGTLSFREMMTFSGELLLIVGGIMLVLGILGYLLYACIMGGKYTILFTLDEKEVVHEQSTKATKKARKIGLLTALAGAAAHRPTAMGSGMMAASRTTMTTTLTDVRRLIPCRRQHLIKVNERLSKNRVFVCNEDFDFVYQFLAEHCPNAKK